MGNVVLKDQFEEITFTPERPGSKNSLDKRATVSVCLLVVVVVVVFKTFLIFREGKGGRKRRKKN